jgi:putative SOS response-associated peptidase YedK
MCGRFTQTKTHKETLEALENIELPPLFHGRYNVAPTQKIALIRQGTPGCAEECIWGFRNSHSTAPIINARIETLAERPMFRDLPTTHRCLIPADGFYEWKDRQPYYFQTTDKALFAFAGLWREDRCIIITRPADRNMQGIHGRMPVIVTPDRWNMWLKNFHLPEIPKLINRPVSRRVNKVAHDDSTCLTPAEVQGDLSLFPHGE